MLFIAPTLGNESLIPEVRLGGSVTMGKEAIVEYSNLAQDNSYTSRMYCFVENETKLNAEIVWRDFDQQKITVYGGFGANLSASFNNDLYVFDNFTNSRTFTGNNFETMDMWNSQDNVFEGNAVFYQRIYFPIGIDIKILRHLQATAEYKFGRGMEQVIGGNLNTFTSGEFNFGLRYNIANNNTPSISHLFN